MKTVVVLYLVSTFVAGLLAVAASYISPSEIVLTGVDANADAASAPKGIFEVITNLLTNALANPIDALSQANYLGILVWSCLLGIAMRHAKQATKDMFADAADGVLWWSAGSST